MPRTHYIFVDFENIPETDLDRISQKPVKVIIILGARHKTLPVPFVKKLLQYAAQIELVDAGRPGRNAADFVLAQHLGEVRKADPEGIIHILSKDKGFDSLVSHNRTSGGFVARWESFSEINVLMNAEERGKFLVAYYAQKNTTRPRRRDSLESQVQTVFGKTLAADELEATINQLVTAKFIAVSPQGAVKFLRDQKPAGSTSPAPIAVANIAAPVNGASPVVLDDLAVQALANLRAHTDHRPKLKAALANYLFSQLGQKHPTDKIYGAIKRLRQAGYLSFANNAVTYQL